MSTFFRVIMLSSIFYCFFIGVTYAQEKQVDILPEMAELTAEIRDKYDVLKELSDDFDKALLFKKQDEYFLRIAYLNEDGQWTEDIPISAIELEELRQNLSKVYLNFPFNTSVDRNDFYHGVLSFSITSHAIAQSRVLSNSFSKEVTVTEPNRTFVENQKTGFGKAFPFIVTAGALAGSAFLIKNKNILPSAVNMHFGGSLLGYGHGYLLSSMIREPYSNDQNANLERIMISGTSFFEGWLGYFYAKRRNITLIQSKAINVGNFWGGVTGLMGYGMFNNNTGLHDRGFGFSGLIGSGIGILASNALIKKYPRASGDFVVFNMAGVVGSSIGLSTAFLLDSGERGTYASLFLGTIGGLAIGGLSTKHSRFPNEEAARLALTTIVGGGLGYGISILYYFNLGLTNAQLATGGAIGFTTGYFIGYLILKNNLAVKKSVGWGEKLKWGFNPAGISMIMSTQERQANLMRQNIRMDLLSLNYAF